MRKFTSALTCAVAITALSGSPAWALTYSTQYEFNAEPSTAAGVIDANAGDTNGNGVLTKIGTGTGETGSISGGLLHFIDNPASSGNHCYEWAKGSAVTYTVDMSVLATNNVGGTNADMRSMAFLIDSGHGRGIQLNGVSGNVTLSNSGGSGTVTLSSFRRLRVTVNASTNTIKVFDLDTPGSAALINFVMPNNAGTGFNGTPGGFDIGSSSGTTTTATDYYVDWFRVLLDTAVEDSSTVIDPIAVAGATTMTIQDNTLTGNGTDVIDTQCKKSVPDNNEGISPVLRPYPDTGGPDPNPGRHELYRFDVSYIPTGSTITTANMGVYFIANTGTPAVTGYRVSRFRTASTWVEGTKDDTTAGSGEPSHTWRLFNTAAWATPGAHNTATDIDDSTTITFNKAAVTEGFTTWNLNANSLVSNWVSGVNPNNGVLLWGGTTADGTNWNVAMSEFPSCAVYPCGAAPAGETHLDQYGSARPKLTVSYTPPADSVGPVFGGSLLTNSVTNSTTPTATVSVQDAGVGLEPATVQFRYSTNSGTTFSDWQGNRIMHSKGTPGTYWYPDIYKPSSFTIISGDHLVYDIYFKNASGPAGSVDVEMSGGPLRDSGILDQNGKSGHPATSLSTLGVAANSWYHRDFNLSTRAGNTIQAFEAAHDGSSANPSEHYSRNIQIINGSTVRLDVLSSGQKFTQVNESVGPGNNAYGGRLVGIDPNPDTSMPVSCTGSNRTTASETVSAKTGTLVAGNTNRIQFRILDLNGNLTTSGQYTITVDQTAPTVANVTSNTADGTYNTGSVIDVRVRFNEGMAVTGTPQLTLNTSPSRVATYSSLATTTTTNDTLVFNYTVQPGDLSADLDYASTSALTLNGGTIKDAAGNNATLTLASPGAAGSLGANKNIVIGGGGSKINVKPANTPLTIDGSPADWNLGEFVTVSRGGQNETGDYALVGYSGATAYSAGHYTGGQYPPTDRADHTARVWSRHDTTYQYFLARIDDSDIRTPNPVGTNWANDCVEIYIDPANAGGASAINNSASAIQLVIDAANQKNVYQTTAGYATQVLAGVTSAVTQNSYEGFAGWWVEVRIQKSALDPDMPATGTFGVEFNFRDNDGSPSGSPDTGTAASGTIYDWADPTSGVGFPSKIPNNWGKAINLDPATQAPVLNIKFAATPLTIDGNPADWNLPDVSTVSRGGQHETGEYALIGYSGATAYSAGHYTGGQYPPTDRADHTARVWSRHDATYQYFLARIDDSEIRTPNPVATNWANDCIEFFIDPGFQRRGTAMVDPTETSYVQLDIDAINQKNVYMCTPGYASTVLAGVTSAVVQNTYQGFAGWWVEVRITKSALNPAMPATGTFGVDFNFRDNDGVAGGSPDGGIPANTTSYDWADPTSGAGVPSKIPSNWGQAVNQAAITTMSLKAKPRLGGTLKVNSGTTISPPSVSSTTHSSGTVVTLDATASAGYYFTGWVGPAGTLLPANIHAASTSITMTSDTEIDATFSPTSALLVTNGNFSGGLTGWTNWNATGGSPPTIAVNSGELQISGTSVNGGVYQQINTGGAGNVVTVTGYWRSAATTAASMWGEVLVINANRTPANGTDETDGNNNAVLLFKNTATGGWDGSIPKTSPNNAPNKYQISFTASGNTATLVLKSGNGGGNGTTVTLDNIEVRSVPATTNYPTLPSGFSKRELDLGSVGFSQMAMHPINRDLYAIHTNGTLYRINPTTMSITSSVSVTQLGGSGRGIAFDTNGDVYLSNGHIGTHPNATGTIVKGTWNGSSHTFATLVSIDQVSDDHDVNGVAINGNDGLLYIHSGSKTHQGEGGEPAVGNHKMRIYTFPLAGGTISNLLQWSGGVRQAYHLAFRTDGCLFGVEAGPDCHYGEEFNLYRQNKDYGFPYMFASDAGGSVDTSTGATAVGGGACGDPSPSSDDLLPASGFYEAAFGNYGPNDKPSSGETGYEDGGVYWSFSPHATPTGCAFYDPAQMDPAAIKFPTEFHGRTFVTSWGVSVAATDAGHDLTSMRLSEGDDAFVCNRFWGGLNNPIDVVAHYNGKLYVLFYIQPSGGNSALIEISPASSCVTPTFSGATSVCANSTGNTATISNPVGGATYSWSITGGTITGGQTSQTVTYTAGTGASLTLSATQTGSSCSQSATGNYVVTVVAQPTTATVGGSQTICTLGTSAGLGGNAPSVGTGAWSVVSGGTGSFNPNNTTPNATFTHATGTGPVVVRWTISNSPCTASSADVSITINQNPTTATVGGPQTICALGTTTGLGGNIPSVGTGAWSVVSGGTGSFNPNNTTPNPTFTHATGAGPVVVRWTISNSPCTDSTADVSITINQGPTTATVGGPQTICALGTTTGLGGNAPSVGTGAWSVVSGGTGSFNPNNTTPNATFTHATGTGPVVVRWTISNSPCTDSTADVTITINQDPTTATVGGPQIICLNGTTAGLGGNAPTSGTGTWSIVTGGFTGTFNPDAGTPNATFTQTGGGEGTCVLRWTISSPPCTPDSSADVTLTIGDTVIPVITLNGGPVSYTCINSGDNLYSESGATWTDNCDGGPFAVTSITYTPAPPDTRVEGVTTVHYNVVDAHGNPAAEVTRTVTVEENAPLTITNLPANLTVECQGDDCGMGSRGTLATYAPIAAFLSAPQASDQCDIDTTITNDAPVCFAVGTTTTVTWTASHPGGTPADVTASRTVTVQDTQAPVITLKGGTPVTYTCINSGDNLYSEQGAMWTDSCDGGPFVVTDITYTPGPPDTRVEGVTTVHYNAVDAHGNHAIEVTRTVTVQEDAPLVISNVPANLVVECQGADCGGGNRGALATYAPIAAFLSAPQASDQCDADATISNDAPACFPVGVTTTVTWTASHPGGTPPNVIVSRTVTVQDTTPPTITFCPPDQTVNADAGLSTATVDPGTATASDNCDTSPTVTGTRSDGHLLSDPYPQGTTTITWTATDSENNMSAQCHQSITVTAYNEMRVSLQLGSVHAPSGGPPLVLHRCVRFELFNCPSATPTVVDQVITFTSIDETHDAVASNASVLVPFGSYSCCTVRDKLHTLRRALTALPPSGGKYMADFVTVGKPLIGGNLNDDGYIDILDFGKYANQYNHTYTPPLGGVPGDTNCSTPAPNADISGNGTTFTEDFSFIQVNFLKVSESSCCSPPGMVMAKTGISSITVADLKDKGMADLAIGDVNGDGVLDSKDITAWMQGARPGQPLPPPPTRKR